MTLVNRKQNTPYYEDKQREMLEMKTKKILIFIGFVIMYLVSVFGGAVFGYNAGYDAAMAEVETRVLDGIERMGDMFDGGAE